MNKVKVLIGIGLAVLVTVLQGDRVKDKGVWMSKAEYRDKMEPDDDYWEDAKS